VRAAADRRWVAIGERRRLARFEGYDQAIDHHLRDTRCAHLVEPLALPALLVEVRHSTALRPTREENREDCGAGSRTKPSGAARSNHKEEKE